MCFFLLFQDLLPLMECLVNVTPHMGRALEPYAQGLFNRALGLVMAQLQAQAAAAALAAQAAPGAGSPGAATRAPAPAGAPPPPPMPEYESDFVVLGLDLISGLVQGLRVSVEALVGPSPLLQVLMHACRWVHAGMSLV